VSRLVSQQNCEFITNENRIDIWHVDLNLSDLDRFDLLSEDEIIRSEKMLHLKNKKLFVRSRCALRLLLAKCLSLNPVSLSFQYGEKGKPQLLKPKNSQLEFNLSHSDDIALISIARERQIGIDISHIKRSTNWEGIAKRSFTKIEQNYLIAPEPSQVPSQTASQVLNQETSLNRFHRIWSQKEAYTKALGLGYSYGFKNFSVDIAGGLIQDSINPEANKIWTIHSFESGDDTVAALAFNGTPSPDIHYWKLDHRVISDLIALL